MNLQTKYGDEGNCLAACLSGILGIDIEDIPVFIGDEFDDWFWKINNYLKEKHNKYMVIMKAMEAEHLETVTEFFQGSLVLTAIDGPKWRHAVITKNMKIVFDPMYGKCSEPLTYDLDPSFLILSDIIQLDD